MRTVLTAASLGLGLLGSATAQCPPSLSFLANAPLGLSMRQAAAIPFDQATPYFQRAGVAAAAPTPWSNAGGPDFNIVSRFLTCTSLPFTAFPDIDAMSIGQDDVMGNAFTGVVDIPMDRWAVLNLSVSRSSTGVPQSVIATEAAHPDTAGADIFTYVLQNSELPADLVEQTFRSHDGREIDLGAGSDRELDALDQFMSLYAMDPGLVSLLPVNPSVFFSVSNATLGLVPLPWWSGTQPSGATILRMTWSPVNNSWSCPSVFKTHAQLGLGAGEDVDALAIDLMQDRILFSTDTPTRDELLLVPCSQDGPPQPKPYVDDQGVKVEAKIGLEDGDKIDAICGIDPSVRGVPGSILNAWHFYAGQPNGDRYFPAPGGSPLVEGSAFRINPATGPALQAQLIGWPPSGAAAGFAILTFNPPSVLNQIFVLHTVPRIVMPAFCGDPQRWTVPVPAALILSEYQFDLRWFVVDAALTEVLDSHPLRIVL